MKGIELLRVVRMFGFRDGFSFWFEWSFVNPLQNFIWLNITHKPYCLKCGWSCKSLQNYFKRGCDGKKLTKKQDILNHMEEMRKELNTIEKGKDDMCLYCGEEKGTEEIPNPNFDKITQWLVCKDCKDTIYNQQQYSLAQMVGNEKLASEAVNKMDEIAKRTKKPIMVAEIRKTQEGYKTSSIKFTGEK